MPSLSREKIHADEKNYVFIELMAQKILPYRSSANPNQKAQAFCITWCGAVLKYSKQSAIPGLVMYGAVLRWEGVHRLGKVYQIANDELH
jgi:hypothetical protein